ncbi:vWA domain-containing protein [Algivirga pacifica]|uniref:VWFA domain-containing protein n=1 Tax=Algivirga pacifica TaxID=1162670 RepID=A0ABP9DIQ5_9BACT
MKKIILFISLSILLFSCEKNPLWVGESEFLTFNYSNRSGEGPVVSSSTINKSHFIDFDSIWTVDEQNGTIQVILDGVRVQSNRHNYEISQINIYEKDDRSFDIQDEFTNLSSSFKTDVATVLVLDMSESLEGLKDSLKEYAKRYVDKVVNSSESSQVAVVFFSSKENIYTTEFFHKDNADELKATIEEFSQSASRTALFQATQEGISILDSLTFEGSKALVVFTDGGDNDSDSPSTLKASIAASNYARISIGLKGNDFDKGDLEAIASSNNNVIVVDGENKLEDAFEAVARQVVSVYKIIYERSDQILDEAIEVKFEFEVNKLVLD